MKYLRFFDEEEEARDWMITKNKAVQAANNTKDLYVLTDGPEDNYCVMHLKDAINNGFLYSWAFN